MNSLEMIQMQRKEKQQILFFIRNWIFQLTRWERACFRDFLISLPETEPELYDLFSFSEDESVNTVFNNNFLEMIYSNKLKPMVLRQILEYLDYE